MGRSNFDPDAIVESDAPCRKCSYNVRGLRYGGRCPECGTPVGVSTLGDLLRFSGPSWLRGLVRGLDCLLLDILATYSMFILSIVVNLRPFNSWTLLATALIGLYGTWLLTEADPSGLGEAQYAAARKIVRITLAIALLRLVIGAMLHSLLLSPAIEVALTYVYFIATLAMVVGEFARFLYLRRLAERIPDPALANRARLLQWTYPALYGLAVIILQLLTASSGGSFAGAVACGLVLLAVPLLILSVMIVMFYLRMRRLLAAQLFISERVWAQAEGQVRSRTGPPE